jgi:aminoglycoside 6-adenylyltransferase
MKRFQHEAIAWAESQPVVRAMLLVGSRARLHPPADEWADLDFEVFATACEEFLSNTAWLDQLGEVWTTVVVDEPGEDGEQAVLALFDGGYKVDFHFQLAPKLRQLAKEDALPEPFLRGYQIVVDKDGLAGQMPSAPGSPPARDRPTPERFANLVSTFWYGTVYVAKQIRRRNLWVVKFRDWTMKEQLLTMMEWHAGAFQGWDTDTFNDGHFLKVWTKANTWEALHAAFGRFDARDSWAALAATMDLFRRLATETAGLLGYVYPHALDDQITTHLAKLEADDRPSR